MDVRITPSRLRGEVCAPPSKSIAHRALICAALANQHSTVSPVDLSKDMDATIGALKAMGASIVRNGKEVRITGISAPPQNAEIDCIESGSTLRFLIPVAAALGISCRFTGSGRLPERTIGPYFDAFLSKGVLLDRSFVPLQLSGSLQPGSYTLPGDISSQFITGLLFALPLLNGESAIHLSTALESAPYIDLTIDVLRKFGIKIHCQDSDFFIPGGQTYLPQAFSVEADFSNAAFFLTAAALGQDVTVSGLSVKSLQGDRKILEALSALGASASFNGDRVQMKRPICRPAEIDIRDIPDLAPILCVAAAAVPGRTVLHGTRRLKIKESDRAAAMIDCLTRLGARIWSEYDSLIIDGGTPLHGAVVSSYGDHRIVMAMAIAALLADGPIVIEQAQAVDKSYPGFFEDFKLLGGVVHVL
ncbi:MAG: 3-phosphoshikimate 1-carboxyvinyltransferase [Oscillospiraceae bacterium]|nr:3-phosphoshikimate 1-carboxyvinyltransferase [Oscillospiraceae bacterium]